MANPYSLSNWFKAVFLPVSAVLGLLWVFVLHPAEQETEAQRVACEKRGGVLLIGRNSSACVKPMEGSNG